MTRGYPAVSGIYWARMYEWNPNTKRYDIEEQDWIVVAIDSVRPIQYQLQYIGSDEMDDVRHVYEYKEIKYPTGD